MTPSWPASRVTSPLNTVAVAVLSILTPHLSRKKDVDSRAASFRVARRPMLIVAAGLYMALVPGAPLPRTDYSRVGLVVAGLLVGFGTYLLHNTLQTQATQLSTEARGAAVWRVRGRLADQGNCLKFEPRDLGNSEARSIQRYLVPTAAAVMIKYMNERKGAGQILIGCRRGIERQPLTLAQG